MAVRTVAVCYPQVPFVRGGAELLVESLIRELNARGFQAEGVSIPFFWEPRTAPVDQCFAWRMVSLKAGWGDEIDRVIGTKFPSYVVRHPSKVTWLTHQFRQVYDLFETEWSGYSREPEDLRVRETIRRIDCTALGEGKALYAISKNVADRAKRYNGLDAGVLYPPPPGADDFRPGTQGDYILSVGRIDALKRVEPLIQAMKLVKGKIRCVIAGTGPDETRLRAEVERLGIGDRVTMLGAVPFEELSGLMSNALGVYFAPYDEDYGYVTLEAFLCQKPVVTAPDSGGPLEFVEDDVTGYVRTLDPESLADAIDRLGSNRAHARSMGEAGYERARVIGWDPVIEALTAE